jgi:glucosamine kinase
MLSLGVDGGASSAKWCLVDESGAVMKQGTLPPVDGHLYRSESLEKFRSFTKALKSDLNDLEPDVISLGITGFGAPELIKSELNSVFPLAKLNLSSDIALAYYSVFAPGQGVFIYAGTGSIAIHITKEGKEITVGGWGYLLGDEGAGYWIGRESLRHLLMQIESNTEFDELSRRISDAVGGSDWSSVREFVYGKDRSAVAALTPIVAKCAGSGVASAQEILNSAANFLVNLVNRMKSLLNNEQLEIKFGGGISKPEIGILGLLEERFGNNLRVNDQDYALSAANFGIRSR